MNSSKIFFLLFFTLFFIACEKDQPILVEEDARISESTESASQRSNGTLGCGDFTSGQWGGIGYHSYDPITLNIPGDRPCEIKLSTNQLDVPNRFTIYNSNGVVVSSGWIGFANYPGPWGSSLDNDNPGLAYLTFIADPNETYTLVVETVVNPKGRDRSGADSWEVQMWCECEVDICVDDCGTSLSGYNSDIGYQVYSDIIDVSCLEPGCTVSLRINPFDVPNRFYVTTPSGQQLLSTPWLGESMNPGLWGTVPDANGYFIYNPGEFEFTITIGSEDSLILRTETVVHPNTTDNWYLDIVCDCSDISNGGR